MGGKKLKIGITQGDTNGIGYEVIIKSLMDSKIYELFTPVVYGSKKISSYHKKALNLDSFLFNYITKAEEARSNKANLIDVTDENIDVEFGVGSKNSGLAAFQSLEMAVKDLQNGAIDALVTAPINKESIQSEDFNFPGHTEYLAEKDGKQALMFLVSDRVKVAVVTGHIPLKDVAGAINETLIVEKLDAINHSLKKDFSIRKPKIAVLGLNPHAGDNGLIGNEDNEIIIPAIEKAKTKGIFCMGPYPADGFFGNRSHEKFDAVLAMYHDQGLIPFKTLAFGEGTNFTAGLSFVRTSPDHGTGFDIAGKGNANPESFLKAIYYAIDIAKARSMNQDLEENKIDPNISKNFYRKNQRDQ